MDRRVNISVHLQNIQAERMRLLRKMRMRVSVESLKLMQLQRKSELLQQILKLEMNLERVVITRGAATCWLKEDKGGPFTLSSAFSEWENFRDKKLKLCKTWWFKFKDDIKTSALLRQDMPYLMDQLVPLLVAALQGRNFLLLYVYLQVQRVQQMFPQTAVVSSLEMEYTRGRHELFAIWHRLKNKVCGTVKLLQHIGVDE